MLKITKQKIYNTLRWSEKYTKTDMVYLAKGSFWLTSGQFISSIGAFLLSVAFANLLPKEIYGTYTYVLSVAALLAIPTLGSMGTSITQAAARGFDGSLIKALKLKIKWGTLGSLASLFISGYYYLNEDYKMTIAFLVASTFIPFMNAFGIYADFLRGRKDFKTVTKYTVFSNIISMGTSILTLFFTNNLFIILTAYFLPRNLVNYFLFKRTLKKFHLNEQEDPKTISYGIYLSLVGIIPKISSNIDKVLVWHFLGAAQVAVYSLAIAPVGQLSGLLLNNTSSLSFPKLSKRPEDYLKKTLPLKAKKFFLIIAPIVATYIIFIPLFFKIFYPQYSDSIFYSQIYALTILFMPISFFGDALVAKMKSKEIAIIKTVPHLFKITLLLILAPIYGIMGVILTQLIIVVFNVSLVTFLFKKMKA